MPKRAGRAKGDKNMTPTAKELWNNPVFLRKRILEQHDYQVSIMEKLFYSNRDGTNTTEFVDRQRELFMSASNLKGQYMERIWEITFE